MTNEEESQALSLGAVVGGVTPVPSAWKAAYRDLANRMAEEAAGVDTPLAVNVVFHIPGEVLKSEFSGVRTGRYSAKLQMLMVQVAIPEMPVPDNVESYLLARVDEAIVEAERFATSRKVSEGRLESLHDIVSRTNATQT